MATEVTMPKMGYDMTEGTLLRWAKQAGDQVAKGDVLGEIETGKVNIEIEAFDSGILRHILVKAGETVPVGTPIAIIGTADEEIVLPTRNAGGTSAASSPESGDAGAASAPESGDASAASTPESGDAATTPSTDAAKPAEQPAGQPAYGTNGTAPTPDKSDSRTDQPASTPPPAAPANGATASNGAPVGGATPSSTSNDAAAPAQQTAGSAPPATSAAPRLAPSGDSAAVGVIGRLRASPLARRIAAQLGVDLAKVAGSGPGGRVTRDDVTAFVTSRPAVTESQPAAPAVPATGPAAPALVPGAATPAGAPAQGTAIAAGSASPAAPAATGIPAAPTREGLSKIRQTIARRLTESWTGAPHIFLTMAINMDAALALRKDVNAALEATGGGKVSVNDLVVKACALALRAHPQLNASYDDGSRLLHPRVNVGVAVALEDGLITVTVPDADQKPLSAIAADVAGKAGRAREGKLVPDDLAVPSTFTISNLGMYGIEHFTAIINPPEAAILAVGAATPTPVVEEGAVVVRQVMHVTLSADHRVVDGATGAEFLVTLQQLLQNPLVMLV